MKRSGDKFFYHYDGNGNTRQLTNSTEDLTDTYTYDTFGIILDRTGSTLNNYLYTGEQYDANIGFYYLRARYLNHQTGHFITQDEFPGNPFEPITLHKYLYANANPVNFIDPSGRMSMLSFCISTAIVSILSSIAYANVSHIYSANSKPVEWSGWLYVFSFGQDAGAGIISTQMESECIDGKKGSGIFLMLMAGYTRGFPLNQSIGKFTMKTPGIYGPSPWTLVGPFAWIAATGSIGFGLTLTAAIYMGMGIGTVNFDSLLVFGLDFSLEVMGGISLPLYFPKKIKCNK
jgi:RHS repeat-associated protein